MSEQDLSLKPKSARRCDHHGRTIEDLWWYEEVGGISVHAPDSGPQSAWIPIGQLRKFIERHDRADDLEREGA